jgi:hypothetical protein
MDQLEILRGALAELPGLADVGLAQLRMLPAKGTAHGHVKIARRPGQRSLVARICYAHPGDADAAARLAIQAEAFRRFGASGCVPRLHGLIAPRAGLPGGALIVDAIEGRAPALPEDLPKLASALAAIHELPVPTPQAALPLPYLPHPLAALMAAIEANAAFFARMAMAPQARQMVEMHLRWARDFSARHGMEPHPIAPVLADTHPGNFLVEADGRCWFVDMEKAHYGAAGIDLAHCTLYTSTRWEIDAVLSPIQTRDFYRAYFALRPHALAPMRPFLDPLRRMTWLRTLAFAARWSVQTAAPRDPSDPGQWSDSGLEPHLRLRKKDVIADYFLPATLARVEAEWLGDEPLNLLKTL